MIYTLYKISNTVNNKIYIGVHGVKHINNIHDNYFGSGTAISRSIKYHGKYKFNKEILCVGSKEYIYKLEEKYVDFDFVKSRDTYNFKLGGDPIKIGAKGYKHTTTHKKFMSKLMKELPKEHPAKATQFKKGHTPFNKGKKMPITHNAKQVLINGVTYPSAKNASEVLGIRPGIVHAKLHNEECVEFLYI